MAGRTGVYRGMSADARVAERRAQLLEATLAVWSEADTRVTMTGICAAAGLTERYFYESFDGLDAALGAVLDDVAAEVERVSRAAADAAGSEPAARVRASVGAFVDLIAADPRKGRVAMIEAVAVPPLRARRTALLRRFAHLSAEAAGERPGLARRTAGEAEVAGLLFVGGLAELVTAWLDGGLDASPAQIVDAAARMFLGLYG